MDKKRTFEELDSALNGSNSTEESIKRQKLAAINEKNDSSDSSNTTIDPRAKRCPYLDTIDRNMLDFDFEKFCSISLNHLNVYACLVCGKYFQGRGISTHAHIHSVDLGHHVFLNLETHRFYCLPDNYEIIDQSLNDIIYLLNPTFDDIITGEKGGVDGSGGGGGGGGLDKMVRAYNGNTYYPGMVGLNNIKANDYCNVILQVLSHIVPVRNFFLKEANYGGGCIAPGDIDGRLTQRFGELIRKLWNPRNFKTHVSPHEFLQAVVLCSKKRFQFTEQSEAIDFLTWLLNSLDRALNKIAQSNSANPTTTNTTNNSNKSGQSRRKHRNIIDKTFRGEMIVETQRLLPSTGGDAASSSSTFSSSRFFYLTLELPPVPLYVDDARRSQIPQTNMAHILAKFHPASLHALPGSSQMRRYQVRRLPPVLLIYVRRFIRNQFTFEKNPTIVNFPIKAVDFGGALLAEAELATHRHTTYDLVGNVVHDGLPDAGKGTYRAHIWHRGSDKWFEMQDLYVEEMRPEMIPLSETLLQVWQVNRNIPNPHYKPEKQENSEKQTVQQQHTTQ